MSIAESTAAPLASPRSRQLYVGLTLLTIALGLASRRFGSVLPLAIRKNTGDALWALMFFFILGTVWQRRTTAWNAGAAIAISFAVEFSQLYHAPWIDTVRDYRLGHLVLGSGFAWQDLIAYVIGVAIGALGEALLRRDGGAPPA